MLNLNQLLEDQSIQSAYALARNENYHTEHNLNHARRVMQLSQKLAVQLKLESDDIEKIGIAAILHDIGASKFGKAGHAERSYEMAKQYTNDVEILNAIRYHGEGYPSDYGYILTLADKLDICRNRVTDLGKTIVGVRQLEHLVALNFDITNNNLKIKFISDQHLDLDELNSYYFISKVFRTINNFAKHFQLKYQVYIDQNPWILS